jgi:hypothetical protein
MLKRLNLAFRVLQKAIQKVVLVALFRLPQVLFDLFQFFLQLKLEHSVVKIVDLNVT